MEGSGRTKASERCGPETSAALKRPSHCGLAAQRRRIDGTEKNGLHRWFNQEAANMPLERRPYGKTGEEVTVIGLGGAGLYKHSFTEGVATVHRALDLGVNYIDTAPHYGRGMSQPILGDALRHRPNGYLLAAKIGMLPSSARFRSYDALRAQLDESLRLLARDSLDTLQVHDVDVHRWWTATPPVEGGVPLNPDYDFVGAPAMQVLRDANAEGLCRCCGTQTLRAFAGAAGRKR